MLLRLTELTAPAELLLAAETLVPTEPTLLDTNAIEPAVLDAVLLAEAPPLLDRPPLDAPTLEVPTLEVPTLDPRTLDAATLSETLLPTELRAVEVLTFAEMLCPDALPSLDVAPDPPPPTPTIPLSPHASAVIEVERRNEK